MLDWTFTKRGDVILGIRLAVARKLLFPMPFRTLHGFTSSTLSR